MSSKNKECMRACGEHLDAVVRAVVAGLDVSTPSAPLVARH